MKPGAVVVDDRATLVETVLAISAIPYGRPREQSPAGVLAEGRGTCSTKHMFLADVVRERWPACAPELWHRVYRVTPAFAARRWGAGVAATIPPDGLVDVHTYATLVIGGRVVRVDVTMPLASWDGVSDIPLACDVGEDSPAGGDPLAAKALLTREHCDPRVREPFIAALSDACGFRWDAPIAEAVNAIASCATRMGTAVDGAAEASIRRRPAPAVWSALEYVVHTGEAIAWYAERIDRIVEEDRPQLRAFDWDVACDERRYNETPRDVALADLAARCAAFVERVHALTPNDWRREGIGADGTPRSIDALIRRAAHEAVHHEADVRAVLAQ